MLESLLMQIVGTDVQAFVQSIIALTTAVVALGAIIAKFIQTHSNNQKTKKWADIVSNDLNATKQSLQATDHWVLGNQSVFTSAMAVINGTLDQEQQKALAARRDQYRKPQEAIRYSHPRVDQDLLYGSSRKGSCFHSNVVKCPILDNLI